MAGSRLHVRTRDDEGHVENSLRSAEVKQRSNFSHAVGRYRKNSLAVAGLIIAVLSIVAAVLAPVIRTHDPAELNFGNVNQWPSSENWFGTDASGTDIYSQMVSALRTSYIVAGIATIIYMFFGLIVGLASGFFGGLIDNVLSRIIDVLFAFPNILVALLIAGTFGIPMYERFGPAGRLYLTVAALSLLSWVTLARVVRSQVLSLREMQYIEAARVSGATGIWILRRHLMPNVLGMAAVMASLGVGSAMTLEAVLSYLGLGVMPPTPSLGRLIQQGQIYIDPHWYQFFLPATVLALLVLAYSFIGDGVRDAVDPRDA